MPEEQFAVKLSKKGQLYIDTIENVDNVITDLVDCKDTQVNKSLNNVLDEFNNIYARINNLEFIQEKEFS